MVAVAVLALFLEAPTVGSARVMIDEETSVSATFDETDWDALAHWVDTVALPIPTEPGVPLSVLRQRGGSAWGSFREPFPQLPRWNPPGVKRVGLQAGHWLFDEAPDELEELRTNPGASGGGWAEWEVNLQIAKRTAEILRAEGVEVDVLPTTVPIRYRAHAFVTIHADGDVTGSLNGFKVGRALFSATPDVDNRLVEALNTDYQQVTGLTRRDEQISRRMTGYYAFNARRYQHAVAPGVPQAIVEAGFMTSASDRRLLIGNPDLAAQGIARGILRFLEAE